MARVGLRWLLVCRERRVMSSVISLLESDLSAWRGVPASVDQFRHGHERQIRHLASQGVLEHDGSRGPVA
jgi:hypothetical protein